MRYAPEAFVHLPSLGAVGVHHELHTTARVSPSPFISGELPMCLFSPSIVPSTLTLSHRARLLDSHAPRTLAKEGSKRESEIARLSTGDRGEWGSFQIQSNGSTEMPRRGGDGEGRRAVGRGPIDEGVCV